MNVKKLSHVTAEEIVTLYKVHGSFRKTAKALGVSHTSLITHCKDEGIPLKNIKRLKTRIKHPLFEVTHRDRYSKIKEYFKDNEDKQVTRNIKALAKEIGTSYSSVQSWLYRRKKLLQQQFEGLPQLNKINILITDDDGDIYSTTIMKKYNFLIDPYKLEVIMRFWLKDPISHYGEAIPDKRARTAKLDDPEQFVKDVYYATRLLSEWK